MAHVFYDIFSITNFSFMQLKFYLGHNQQKYGWENKSFAYHIGVLLIGDMKYTYLDPT